MFRFGFVHLQHSNVSKLNTVCALHYKFYCAYTPSNGAMALLNKISIFRILSLSLYIYIYVCVCVCVCVYTHTYILEFPTCRKPSVQCNHARVGLSVNTSFITERI